MPSYELNLRDYYRIVRRHIVVIAAVSIGLGALSYMLTEQMPTYRATATVRIQRSSDVTSFLMETFYWSPEDNISTQVRLISSQQVLLKVAQVLDGRFLKGYQDGEPIYYSHEEVVEIDELSQVLDTLAGQISAQQVESTGLVDIIATIPDPDRTGAASERATTLAQYAADAFRQYSDEQAKARTTQASEFIEERLEIVQGRLDSSRTDLQQFLEDNLSTATADVSGLSVLIDRQRNLLSRIELLQEHLRRLRTGDFTLPSSGSSVDPAAVSYQVETFRQLTDLLNRRADLLVTYTPQAPAVRALEARIEEVRRDIRSTLVQDLASLRSQLDSINGLLQDYPAEEIELATRRRAVELNTLLYEQLQTRQQELDIQEQGVSSEVTIVNYPTSASSDQQGGGDKGLKAIVGLLLGLMLGVLLAFILESMDTSIGTIEDVEEYLELPVLAVIPHLGVEKVAAQLVDENPPLGEDPNLDMYARLIPHYDPKSPAAEAYRTLRTNLQFATVGADVGAEKKNTFVFTSASLQEGKTTTIINLAITMAQAGNRVLLMGCNMRRPTIYKSFGVPREKGMTDILTGQLPWRDCVKTITDMMVGPLSLQSVMSMPGLDNLHLITAGGIPPNPSELLNSPRFGELIAEVRHEYDCVIVDCPPILPVTDAAVVGRQVDWSVLIYQVGKVPRNALRRARTHLQNVGARVLGIAMNDVRSEISGYSPYSQYMTKYYGEESKKRRRTLLQRLRDGLRRSRRRGEGEPAPRHQEDEEKTWIDVPYLTEENGTADQEKLARLPYSRIAPGTAPDAGEGPPEPRPTSAEERVTGPVEEHRSLLDRIPLWVWLITLLVVVAVIVLSLLGIWSGSSTAAIDPAVRVAATGPPSTIPAPPPPPRGTTIPVWSVQAGSFREAAAAEALARTLKGAASLDGDPVWTRAEEVPGLGVWYRVWVGRYERKEEGEAAVDRVRRSGRAALALLRSTTAPLP